MPHGNYEIPGPLLNKELCSFKAITRSKKAVMPIKILKGTSAERQFEFRMSVGSWIASHDPGRPVVRHVPAVRVPLKASLWLVEILALS